MKIAIIGSHSVGKTTLIKALNKHLSLPIITEVARKFPRDITDNPVVEMWRQTNILDAQLFAEMQHDEFLSDRSTLDNAAYIIWAMQKYHSHLTLEHFLDVFKRIQEARRHAEKYDHLFYVPIEFACVDDGFRNTDEDERKFIDGWVHKMWVETGYKSDHKITGTVEERVNKILEILKC